MLGLGHAYKTSPRPLGFRVGSGLVAAIARAGRR
jgi:hypothetical protein